MNRHILRFAFFFAVLFAFATSAYAQATGSDCSTADQPTKTWNQQPPGALCGTGRGATPGFTVYSTTVDTCTDQNTGSAYAQSVRQVTGNGLWQCWSANSSNPSLDMNCNPTITQQVTHALSSTDYNRFYLRAWDADPSKYCGTFADMSRQDFWQCPGVDCQTSTGPPCYVDNSCADGPSPIILDIDGHGFVLTNAADGVLFDISGTGHPIQMGWTARGAANAFLALPGVDGMVHNGKELFGNFTPQPKSSTPNGFAALAVYDDPNNGGNGDGIIDSRDAVFSSLRLWIDANHDGICQPDELHTLPSLGVTSISLAYKSSRRTDQYGNVFRYRAPVDPNTPDPAHVGRTAYDIFFVTLKPSASAKNLIPWRASPASQKCPAPVPIKGGMLSTGTLR
jgi:hypothetical protein